MVSLMSLCVQARSVPASHQNESTGRAESWRAYRAVAYRVPPIMLLDWHTENACVRDPDAGCDDDQRYEDYCRVDLQPQRYPL